MEPFLVAVAVAVIVTTLLWSKTRIHRFVRRILTEVEVEDAIKFFVVAFVVLPLLPDRDLGPYGQLNPEKLWLLVVLFTGIGWVGYIGVRALGPERGLLVTGLAGGFVSATATATTASMGAIDTGTALVAIAAALGSNLLVKTVLAVTAGGRRFGLGFAAGMAVPAVVFGGVLASTVAGL
ncbi:MAG: MgtC/SapB family protein [Mycolicibacterium sp.]|nr:MgtC/SapB family protein [Mycolicibacterium sp.]